MLTEVKRALPYDGTLDDGELARLCKAGAMDLTTRGVILPGTVDFEFSQVFYVDPETGDTVIDWNTGLPMYTEKVTDNSTLTDDLCMRAIITYVKMNFGNPPNYGNLKESYEIQLGKLMVSGDYTDYSMVPGAEPEGEAGNG